MPIIAVTLMQGYPAEVHRRLCERLSDAAMATIAAPAAGVTVAIHEVAPSGYMRGREAKQPGEAPPAAAEIALDLLDAQGAREADRVAALTEEGFAMTFPGGARFTDLEALGDWAATRYRRIAKSIERVEEAPLGETVAVYVSGTLHGEWPDGTAFEGIRFVDRFEISGGRALSQEVWNDLGAARDT